MRVGDTDNATTYLKSGKCVQLEKGVKVSASAFPAKEVEIMNIDLLGDNLWFLNSFLSDFQSTDFPFKIAQAGDDFIVFVIKENRP